MIVRLDKSYIKSSESPASDWLGDADFILDDNTAQELEDKIISLYPDYDFVTEDGKLIDVVATEPAPEPLVITDEQRINALENALEELIEMLMEE